MGSIHNIPNYAAVGGFIFLGLSPLQVMLAVVLSSFIVATFMNLNGVAGSKYGIPFAMHLVYLRQSRGKTARVLKRLCGRDCLVWSANIYRIAGFINYSREILAELLEIGGSFQFLVSGYLN